MAKLKYLKGTSRHKSNLKKGILHFIHNVVGIEDCIGDWYTDLGTENITVKYFDPSLPELEKIEGDKSDWIDLYSRTDVSYNKNERVVIPLNVAMALPEGYEAHLMPRSSTFRKYGIFMISSGIMDGSYCGNDDEWIFECYSLSEGFIHKGTRVAQFRIYNNQPKINFVKKNRLVGNNRGGFGSTGTGSAKNISKNSD